MYEHVCRKCGEKFINGLEHDWLCLTFSCDNQDQIKVHSKIKHIINWLKQHRNIETKKYGKLHISDKDIDTFLRIYVHGETTANIAKEKNTTRHAQANHTSHVFYQIKQNTGLTNTQIKESFLMLRFFPIYKSIYKKYCRKKGRIIYVPVWRKKKLVEEIGSFNFYQIIKIFNIKILTSNDLIDDELIQLLYKKGFSIPTIAYLLGFSKSYNGKIVNKRLKELGIKVRSASEQMSTTLSNIRQGEHVKELWKNKEWAEKQLQKMAIAQNIRPNKPETFINKNTPNSLRYVGNWKKFIWFQKPTMNPDKKRIQKRKNPDFIDEKQKKVIEFDGEHCHSKEEADWVKKEYAKVGYSCLIVWYKEYLNDPQEMLIRIYKFIGPLAAEYLYQRKQQLQKRKEKLIKKIIELNNNIKKLSNAIECLENSKNTQ